MPKRFSYMTPKITEYMDATARKKPKLDEEEEQQQQDEGDIVLFSEEEEEEDDIVELERQFDTRVLYQTTEELVLSNPVDFVAKYRDYVPSESSKHAIVNLYRTVVHVCSGKSCYTTRNLFGRTEEDEGVRSRKREGQMQIDERVSGGRDSNVHDSICSYLVPTVIENDGRIPLPLKSADTNEGFVHLTDSARVTDHGNLVYTNEKILALLLATVFDETSHLRCVDFDRVSTVDYALECLRPQPADAYNEEGHRIPFIDDKCEESEYLSANIEKLDRKQLECVEKFANYLLSAVQKKKEEIANVEPLVNDKWCAICTEENVDFVTYGCCTISVCFSCVSQSMSYASELDQRLNCCVCRKDVDYVKMQ